MRRQAALYLALTAAGVLIVGCSFFGRKHDAISASLGTNEVALDEESRALTTAALDALHFSPTNRATDLALELLTWDQQIEGLPLVRIDVASILASNKIERLKLDNRFLKQNALIIARAELQNQLDEANAKLIELGKQYEKEKNRSIVGRIWAWSIATLGIGGIVALCVFCPFLIPIVTHMIAFIIGRIPQLASMLGVVSKRAFDAVVSGVQATRKELDHVAPEIKKKVDSMLKESTDHRDRVVISARKKAMRL